MLIRMMCDVRKDGPMPPSRLITPLTNELSVELRQHWQQTLVDGDPQLIRHDFEQFASQAISQGISLEEAMSAAGVAINAVAANGNESTIETASARMIGVGLGAIARIYLAPADQQLASQVNSVSSPIARL